MSAIEQPKKILHIGDIHVFRNKRHKEHLQVFQNLIKIIQDQSIDLVYVGGDVVDSKARLSPDEISVTSEMFKLLGNICPVIVIPGNHDIDLKQKGALDSLTPILQNIETKHPIYYLTETGIYNLYNIDWAVWSCIDNKNPFDGNKAATYTIGCYHGPIKGCMTSSGWSGFTDAPGIEIFEKCDTVFLADIHKTQYFRNGDIAYCGSLLQVTVDEDVERGGLVWIWDGSKYTSEFIQVPNHYGFVTYNIDNLDKFDVNSVELKTTGIVCRLLYLGSQVDFSLTKLQELKKQVKEKYPDNEVVIQKRFKKERDLTTLASTALAKTTKKKDYFKEFFGSADKQTYDGLIALDKKYDKSVDTSDYQTGEYFIEELEIENFLSYGGNNKINFKQLEGLIGLFAPNTYGKTSTLHALMFALFNKTPKDSSTLLKLINDQMPKDTVAFVQVKLRINGVLWRIKRSIIPNKKNATITLEVFEYVDGIETPRHEESRPKTDANILKKLLGDQEMFLTLVLYTGDSSSEFVKNKNADRLDLILKFLGITVYDQKLKLVDDEIKTENVVYKQLLKDMEKLTPAETLQVAKTIFLTGIEDEEKVKYDLEQEHIELDGKHEKLKTLINSFNLIGADLDKDTLDAKLARYQRELTSKELLLKKATSDIELMEEQLQELFLQEIQEVTQKELTQFEIKIAKLKGEKQSLEKQLKEDKCRTCGQDLCIDKDILKQQIDELDTIIQAVVFLLDTAEANFESTNKRKNLNTSIEQKEKDVKLYEHEITNVKANISAVEQQLIILRDNQTKIEQKNVLINEADELHASIKALNKKISDTTSSIAIKRSRLEQTEKDIKAYEEKLNEVKTKETQINLLTLYKSGVHRTGIPAIILQEKIPFINSTLMNYTAELFDFQILFEYSDDILDVLFTYPKQKGVRRDVAQASGMEGTVINLAIRAALSEISLLPKPSLLMVDEIFHTLDEFHLEKCIDLLTRLKDSYQNIVVISHLDDLKDTPDHYITLEKENNVTKIRTS